MSAAASQPLLWRQPAARGGRGATRSRTHSTSSSLLPRPHCRRQSQPNASSRGLPSCSPTANVCAAPPDTANEAAAAAGWSVSSPTRWRTLRPSCPVSSSRGCGQVLPSICESCSASLPLVHYSASHRGGPAALSERGALARWSLVSCRWNLGRVSGTGQISCIKLPQMTLHAPAKALPESRKAGRQGDPPGGGTSLPRSHRTSVHQASTASSGGSHARIRARLHAMTTEAHGQQRPSVHVASVVLSALRCCQRANSGGRRRAGRGCCLQGEGIHSVVLAAVPAGVLELTCGSQKGWRRDAEAEARAQ